MIKIFGSSVRREIDKYTIQNEPIASIGLMERAAWQCSKWIMHNFGRSNTINIFCGKGNNAGDGLAIARHLAQNDYQVFVYCFYSYNELSNDAKINFERLTKYEQVQILTIQTISQIAVFSHNEIVIDAIFGSGLNRSLNGFIAEVIDYLNQSDAIKIAIDIPSGLPAEAEFNPSHVFKAHFTLTFQFPFLVFLLPEFASYVGNWVLLDIGLNKKIINNQPTLFQLVENKDIQLINRPDFGYKNMFGHALLIAGSEGMAGASLLCSKACISSGCGLVTTHIPKNLLFILQTFIPEVMASIDKNKRFVTSLPNISKYAAIGVGPGIGTNRHSYKLLKKLIYKTKVPLVIDADGLNILAQNLNWLKKIPENTILTPHPGEFDRLFGKCQSSVERLKKLQWACTQYKIIIVLKGRYTTICNQNGNCYFNSTGNVGMATAGSGDVLTGIITSLLAQGYQPLQAAITGVFIHGLAGDLAVNEKGKEALIASDIIQFLPNAFKSFNNKQFNAEYL